jgi:succinylarginine dihydrolase
MSETIEVNLDGLVGPTHHFGGLGVGNLASKRHRHLTSSPKRAALEGLRKAFQLAQSGVPQFVLPPLPRPDLQMLERYGFEGSQEQQLCSAFSNDLTLFSSIFSSSFMWAANMATVTAAGDSRDGKLHLTVANLISSIHRSIEADSRLAQLIKLFAPMQDQVTIHPPLPGIVPLRDEGAANHMRLTAAGSPLSLNLFVHGDDPGTEVIGSSLFPRHTLAASKMIARHHQLNAERTFFLRQHPEAVSAGVFHNDVIATSHQQILIHHEKAFADESMEQLSQIENAYCETFGQPLLRICVRESELSLEDAVTSYLFNSQIVTPSFGGVNDSTPRMLIVCPQQCREIVAAHRLIETWLADPLNPIDEAEFVELRQSMAGGGGPACLRLRIPLSVQQVAQLLPSCRLDQRLFERLSDAIDRLYPERLQIGDLREQDLIRQAQQATQTLTEQLGMSESIA